MIKINLLGDDTSIDHSGKFILAGFLASLVICAAFCGVLLSSVNTEIDQLGETAQDLEMQLAQLKKKTKAVEDLENKKKLLSSKLALIARLKKSKIGPVRVLDDLNVAVPSRVWLRRVVENEGSVEIKGRALNNKEIALFIRNLNGSDYFSEVELSESNLMFYSKRSGKVVPAKSLQSLRSSSPDFGSESRSTKESAVDLRGMRGGKRITKGDLDKSGGRKWAVKSNVKSGDITDRNRFIDEKYVRINEFKLTAKINYQGRLLLAADLNEMKPKSRKRK